MWERGWRVSDGGEGIPKAINRIWYDLVVEILSPGNTRQELEEQLHEYFTIGVRMVWVVNIRQHCVAVYRAPDDVCVVCEDEQVSGADVVPGFVIEVGRVFET
jgi:Uma2 family endonuclease